MEAYDPKSCNALEKPYYKPIEAALRWCGLIAHEAEILRETNDCIYPSVEAFPMWPCLRANVEKIHDAIMNGEIPYGRDGRAVADDDHVAEHRRTVRHTDLKVWMARHYPDQKPKFLFDEIERSTHSSINADAFRALQAERDALKARIEKATEMYRALKADRDAIEEQRVLLAALLENAIEQGAKPEVKPLTTKERNTLLRLVIGMAVAGYGYDSTATKSPIPKQIADDLSGCGISVSDDTVRNYLKEAASAFLPVSMAKS